MKDSYFMKWALLLAAALACLPQVGRAQVTCASGTPEVYANGDSSSYTTQYFPGNGYYKYSYTEVIIPAAQLQGAGDIVALQFFPTSGNTNGTHYTDCNIYLGHTTQTSLNSGFIQDMNTFELVYSGSLNFTAGQWRTVEFDEPFTYDDESNVVVAIQRNTGSYGTSGKTFVAYNAGNNNYLARSVNQDSGPYTIGSITGGSATYTVPVYRLISCPSVPDACARVTDLTATDVSDTEATLSWNDEAATNTGATYTILNGEEVVAEGISEMSYTLTGLEPVSTYTFTVQAECEGGDVSRGRSITFSTLCGAVAVPYSQNFDALATNALPECWTHVTPGSNSNNYVGAVNSPVHGNSGMCLRFYYSSADGNVVALPPTAAPLNTLQMRFWARPESITDQRCGTLYAGYVTDPADASTFVAVDSMPYNSFAAADFVEFEVPLNSAPTGAMAALSNKATGNNWYFHVDDVVLEPLPTCIKVSGLQASNITVDGVSLSWTDGGNSSATYSIWNGNVPLMQGITGTEATLTGLTPNTYYTLGVRADCSETDTSRRVEVGFRTLCANEQPLPYTEGFEGYAAWTWPSCWERAGWYVSNSTTYPTVYNNQPRTGLNRLHMYYQAGYGTTPDPQLAIGPVMEGAGNNLHVSFWAMFASNTITDVMEAGVVNEAGEASSFVPLLTVAGDQVTRQVYTHFEFYTDNLSSGAPVRVAFRWTSNSNSNLGIDDVLIEEAPTCRMPIGPTVRDITYEAATLSWTDFSSSPHAVRYATTDDVNAAGATTLGVESGSSATLDGLQSNTTYYAWVSTECDGDTLGWVAFGSFTTQRDCYPVVNARVSQVGLTSAVLNWEFDNNQGREPSEVEITITDVANPTSPRTMVADGTTAILSALEPAHTYLVVLRTTCGEYTSQPTSLSVATPACGLADGGGSWQYGPFNGFYSYGYSQTLYPAEVVSSISTITGLQFSIYSRATSIPNRTVDIYLANTSLTDLDTNVYLPISAFTLVAEDVAFNVNTAGWKTINFDTPFDNQRGQNLVVAVVNKTGSGQSFMWNCHEAASGAMVCWNSSDAAIDLSNPMNGASTPSRGRYTRVADVSFLGECDLEGCRPPVLALANANEYEIELAWLAEGTEEDWVVEYRRPMDSVWTQYDEVSDTTALVDGLEAATNYLLRVGALCDDDTLYSNIINTHTACADMEYPYTESFEEWSAEVFPACWQRPMTLTSGSGSNAATYPRVSTGEAYAHSGNNGIEMRATSNNPTIIASPRVALPADLIHVEVWAKLATYNNTVSLQVGLMSDPADATTFVPVETFNVQNYLDWQMYECYTDAVSFEGEDVYVAVRQLSSSSTGFNLYLDDITISEDLDCRRPKSGGIVGYTYNSATLHWTRPTSVPDSYSVLLTHSYSTEDEQAVEEQALDTVATVNGLDFGTEYHAWVASVCASGQSDWFYLGTFTTDERCMPVTGLNLSSIDPTAAVLAWEYDTVHGVEATGAHLLVRRMDNLEASPLQFDATGMGEIITPLEPGTTYEAWVTTRCTADTSRTAPSIVFTTTTCAMEYSDDVNNTAHIPLRENGARHSYCQSLYPPSILNGVDSVRGVAFRVNNGTEEHEHPLTFDVYMGSTSRTSLGRLSYVPASQMMKVVSNYTLDVKRGGWFVIPFDTVFVPNADSNLVVTVVNNTGTSYSQYLYWNQHSSTYSSTLHYYNNTADELDPDSLAGQYTTYNTTPDIMLIGNCTYGCKAPAVVVEQATQQSITIRWAASEQENEWVVGYNSGDSVWHDAMAYSTTYTFEGLGASSFYNLRVGTLCYGNDPDAVPDTLFATLGAYTLCGVAPVPFTPVFTAALGPCWSVSHPSSVYAETSPGSLFIASPYYYAILPELDQELADVQLKMNFSLSNTSYSLMIGATADGGANIEWVDTIHVPTAHVAVETVTYFLNYTGEGRRIVVANGSGTYYTRIPSLVVEPRDVCFPIDSLRATTNVGSALLSWVGPSDDATYVVEYRPSDATGWTRQVVEDSTSLLIRGLSHSTAYTARVQAVCTMGDTSRWTEVSFTTPCDAVPMPLDEDFEALAGNGSFTSILNCWNFYEAAYDSVMDGTARLRPMSGYRWSSASNVIDGHSIRLNIYGDIHNVCHWAVSPAIAVDDAEPLVAFDYSVTFYNNNSTAADPDDRFLLLATRDGGRTWESLAMWGSDAERDTFQLTTAYNTTLHVEVPMQGYFGDTVRIAFYGQSTVPGNDIYFNIDNIHIGHRECPRPTIDSITRTTTSLTLHFSGADDCEVAIAEGEWDEPTTGTALTGTVHTFDNLQPGTAYAIGLRRLCDDGYHSRWTTATATTVATHTVSLVAVDINGLELGADAATFTGAGTYAEGSTATVSVTPAAEWNFLGWTDDVSVNPQRTITVNSDTTLRAILQPVVGIGEVMADGTLLTLAPNPAHSQVAVSLGKAKGETNVELLDMAGRSLGRWTMTDGKAVIDLASVPQGTYFVRVATPTATAIGKLVVR